MHYDIHNSDVLSMFEPSQNLIYSKYAMSSLQRNETSIRACYASAHGGNDHTVVTFYGLLLSERI
jgi:hypothetical protein